LIPKRGGSREGESRSGQRQSTQIIKLNQTLLGFASLPVPEGGFRLRRFPATFKNLVPKMRSGKKYLGKRVQFCRGGGKKKNGNQKSRRGCEVPNKKVLARSNQRGRPKEQTTTQRWGKKKQGG